MKVKELLTGPEKWTQNAWGRNIAGQDLFSLGKQPLFVVSDPSVVCWCLIGAVMRCYPRCHRIPLDKICKKLKTVAVTEWNDAPERTFEDVRKLVEELDI